uniref:Helicase C-terminal domain-containing protein n=1 Tax=Chenopodium quinoa TaxID=63459 RepID=A0A803N967_CHEQI
MREIIFALLCTVHYPRKLVLDRLTKIMFCLVMQATMFNDATSEFDVLVATDAIGMGLNLNISRIIFSTLQKFDGQEMRDLTVPEIKQIAGRAGRYGSKYPVGEVTCLNEEDLLLLHSSLNSPSPDLERAGLFPSYDLLLMYSRANPQNGLYQILEHFSINAKLASNYFMSNCEELLGLRLSITIGVLDILASDLQNCWHAKRDEKVAAIVDELPLGLREKYIFCISPVDVDDDISAQGLVQFAQTYAKKGIVNLREIFTPGTLKVPKTPAAMQELESIHKVLELYVWLSYRLDDSFPDREMAASQKSICSMLIEEFLEQYGWQQPQFKKKSALSKLSLLSLLSVLFKNCTVRSTGLEEWVTFNGVDVGAADEEQEAWCIIWKFGGLPKLSHFL